VSIAMGVQAVVVPRPLAVEALTITGCEARVTNTGTVEAEFSVTIDREAAAWGWVTPPTVTVAPGAEGSVKVLFRLPKAPRPPAGPFPFTVTVTSLTDPSESATADGIVDVQPIQDVVATLNPRTAQGSGPSHHTVAVSNRGNAPVRARLSASDAGGNLDFDFEPVTIEAAAGASAEAKLRVSPKQRLRRGVVERPFEVVAEADGYETLRVDGSLTQEGAGFSRTAIIVAVVVALLAVGGAAVALVGGGGGGGGKPNSAGTTGTGPATAATSVAVAAGDDPNCPAKGHDNHDRGVTGDLPFNYSFLFTTPDGCQPVRFNPCDPVHYIVNPANAPAGGLADVHTAMKMIADAGGYTLVDDGVTDSDRFDFGRLAYDPAKYGERWAPIVISWSHLGNSAANDVVIAGMGNGVTADGAIVTGMLNLNADARIDLARTTPVPDGFGSGISWGRVMLHELGHVFGLGHVQSKNAIMHEQLLEQTLSKTEYGTGDLQAWRLLGKQAGCGVSTTAHTIAPLGRSAPTTPTTPTTTAR
jgi:hypothetical protein